MTIITSCEYSNSKELNQPEPRSLCFQLFTNGSPNIEKHFIILLLFYEKLMRSICPIFTFTSFVSQSRYSLGLRHFIFDVYAHDLAFQDYQNRDVQLTF